MRVKIEGSTGVLLDIGVGENVLLPSSEAERAQAFDSLMGALALLGGIRPPTSSFAKAAATDAHSAGTARYPDGRTDGVVVHLLERLASPSQSSTLAPADRDQTDC